MVGGQAQCPGFTPNTTRPPSLPNLNQVLPVPKQYHKKFHNVVVIKSGRCIARSDILAELNSLRCQRPAT